SRTAVCSGVSPASMCPLGSDHSSRPLRSNRPMITALTWSSSTTRPPADVSSTVVSRLPRRRLRRPARAPFGRPDDGGMNSIVIGSRRQLAWFAVSTMLAKQNAVVEVLRISPVADELTALFTKAGHGLFLVGGSVRDALLGRLAGDLDFTTDARPDQVMRLV